MTEPRHFLLADDSENDLMLMRLAFKKAGNQIPLHEVRNGEEAIAYLKGEGPYGDRTKFPLPCVMLLDLNMPKLGGFEVLELVRAQPGLKRLTIIVLSASLRNEDVARAFDLGTNSFLVKPSTLEALAGMLKGLNDWIQINQFPSLVEKGS